jgi:putative iron-only hydrogenase system regulator
MEKRIAAVGILVKNPKDIFQITSILSEFMDVIGGQMNISYPTKDLMTITLIIDRTTDQVGALTGKLCKIEGVKVKSAITE